MHALDEGKPRRRMPRHQIPGVEAMPVFHSVPGRHASNFLAVFPSSTSPNACRRRLRNQLPRNEKKRVPNPKLYFQRFGHHLTRHHSSRHSSCIRNIRAAYARTGLLEEGHLRQGIYIHLGRAKQRSQAFSELRHCPRRLSTPPHFFLRRPRRARSA